LYFQNFKNFEKLNNFEFVEESSNLKLLKRMFLRERRHYVVLTSKTSLHVGAKAKDPQAQLERIFAGKRSLKWFEMRGSPPLKPMP